MICKICEYTAKNANSLGKHIHHSHKNMSKEEYYNKYIANISHICECGNVKKFRGLGEGYRKFCSVECRSKNIEVRKRMSISQKGKTQSKEHIEKRIKNTDQDKKEKKRKHTMLEKYGVENPAQITEVKNILSEKSLGRKIPRTLAHSKKIIDSKRKNGTLFHSNATRSKITHSLNNYYQTGDNQSVTVSSLPSNGRGHKTGFHNNILYRSSYELAFIIFCERNNILLESCENKERRVRYTYEGKRRWYYPDFYLPELDICVEIKPLTMMNDLFYAKKNSAEQQYNNFLVITENELIDEVYLYEHLHTR